jgi:hypothetical protein
MRRAFYGRDLTDRTCVVGRVRGGCRKARASERGTSQVELLARVVVGYRRVDDDNMNIDALGRGIGTMARSFETKYVNDARTLVGYGDAKDLALTDSQSARKRD